MTEPPKTELARVLEALDINGKAGHYAFEAGARLLREMARDFDEYADHGLDSRGLSCPLGVPRTETHRSAPQPCTCGLDAARQRWRLLP